MFGFYFPFKLRTKDSFGPNPVVKNTIWLKWIVLSDGSLEKPIAVTVSNNSVMLCFEVYIKNTSIYICICISKNIFKL